ncbi:hypothetical protein [Dyella sp. C11]|uniref:hypothetical protein n=1 Tax=Dyella sp. C11 TaxID=2126991 RepID=UPI000D64F1F1|nr:hypothetical protein [Dyella sp. C11]
MSNIQHAQRRASDASPNERAWARNGGLLFALAALVAMAAAVEWNVGMMMLDPLVWMMMLAAGAVGLVSGYALNVRVYSPATE